MKSFVGTSGVRQLITLLAVAALAISAYFAGAFGGYALAWMAGVSAFLAALTCIRLGHQSPDSDGTHSDDTATPILFVSSAEESGRFAGSLAFGPSWRLIGTCGIDQFAQFVRKSGVSHACVACEHTSYERRRAMLEEAATLGVTLWLLESGMGGTQQGVNLRKWRIDDILISDFAESPQFSVQEFIAGKVVLVTGAGGSIGGELCRQIAANQPSLLVLLEQSEFALYCIEQQLGDQFPHVPTVAVIGDVKSETRVGELMLRYQPAVVFHAAAYKHVPLMEDLNAWEALRNNVLGTYVLARAAIEHSVGKFVLVSTDKAVNPTNIMGASKRLAEMVCQALQQTTPLPKFEMVRFGNVLGSAGSVIPRFESQISRGGPVTVTHPDMVRYFMSVSEAAQLVLQAGTMGLGGEIFVMDMGRPVRILDVAQDMIRLAGSDAKSIPITFTGLRPGEKLFEELLLDGEETRATPHARLRVAKAREVPAQWLEGLLTWIGEETGPDAQSLRRQLKRWVPEYAAPIRPQLRSVAGGRSS